MMTVQDTALGELMEYLDTPLPDNWESRTPEERRAYIWGDTLDDHAAATRLRTCVSAVEVRVELLGEPRVTFKRDPVSAGILSALNRAPGWTKGKKRIRIRGYGAQWVYYRDGYAPGDEDGTGEMSTAGGHLSK